MQAPGFWDDQEAARQVIARLKYVKALVDPLCRLAQEAEEEA